MTHAAAVDFRAIRVLTFDCYGTLIDWEAGILAGLRDALGAAAPPDDALLESYAAAEARLEAGPWRPYRAILGAAFSEVCSKFGLRPTRAQVEGFGDSVADWPAFPDSAEALAALRARFALGVITNCDDDLFAASNRRLAEPFTWIVTAQQLRSYKPNPRNFELALERIGHPRKAIMHVAQSLFHDHVPARRLGLATAWIDRRQGVPGAGATPVAEADPTVICPDMATFASLALA
jgi:2-haloacid dehalogenase